MTTKTYWLRFPRNFGNEYTIGIATSAEHGEQYEAEGYERISRDRALRLLSDRGDNATQLYADATLDGNQVYSRHDIARAIRTGGNLESGME